MSVFLNEKLNGVIISFGRISALIRSIFDSLLDKFVPSLLLTKNSLNLFTWLESELFSLEADVCVDWLVLRLGIFYILS